jgi:hypothetical protein
MAEFSCQQTTPQTRVAYQFYSGKSSKEMGGIKLDEHL